MRVEYRTDSESAAQGVEASEFNIDLSRKAKLVTILSSGLYRDKVTSVIREISSNAYDSHVMKGTPEAPFDFTVPTWEKPHLIIRDYGVGLTPEEAEKTMFSYLGSAKDDSDDFIGGWGLGSKSPYAYTNEFEVTLYKDGKYWVYNCWQNKTGIPDKAIFDSGETDQPNGVKVCVPVKTADVINFQQSCVKYLNETNFNINVTNPTVVYLSKRKILHKFEHEGFDFAISNHAAEGVLLVVYGGFVYRISELEGLEGETKNLLANMKECVKHSVLVGVKVGDCEFNVARESLAGSEVTLLFLNRAIKAMMSYLESAAFQYYDEVLTKIEDNITAAKRADGTVDFGKINSHNTSYLNQHPVFSYVDYKKFVDTVAQGDIKAKLTKGVSASSGVWNLKLECQSAEITLSNGRKWDSRNEFKQIKSRLNSNHVRKMSVHHAELTHTVNILAPLRNQYRLVWTPNKLIAKYIDRHTDPIGKVFAIVVPTRDDAEKAYAALGFIGFPVEDFEAFFDSLSPETIKTKRTRVKRDGPALIRDYITGNSERYDPEKEYYYITPDEHQALGHSKWITLKSYAEKEDYDTHFFVASPNFIQKQLKNLDNFSPFSDYEVDVAKIQNELDRAYQSREFYKGLQRPISGDNYFNLAKPIEFQNKLNWFLGMFGMAAPAELFTVASKVAVGYDHTINIYSGIAEQYKIKPCYKTGVTDCIQAAFSIIANTDLRLLNWDKIMKDQIDVGYLVSAAIQRYEESQKEVVNG